jgi:hypothetical protein
MSLKRSIALCLTLLLSLSQLQCAAHKPAAHTTADLATAAPAAPGTPDRFSVALAQARQHLPADEFAKTFSVDAKFSLSGQQIKNLSQFRVSPDGGLALIDYDRMQAEAYDSAGHYTRPLGGTGNEPGAHVWPADIAVTAEHTLAVADFQGHRVNIFMPDGKLQSSFIYTPQNFSAQRILYDDLSHSFYLFGNRWQYGPDRQVTGAELIHKYTATGDYVASYLPFPDQAKPLDLYAYDFPATDIEKGDLFIALPFDYTIYRLTAAGQLSTYLTAAKSAFKAPATGLQPGHVSPAESYRYVQNWRLGWTPINNLVVVGDRLLVQYQTFNPLRYTIDVWALAAKRKVATINTNYCLLTKGAGGQLYFLENLEAKDQEHYDIVRAKLKLS